MRLLLLIVLFFGSTQYALACCKYCSSSSKPCGDSCISLSRNCNTSGGCACSGSSFSFGLDPSGPTTTESTYSDGIAAGIEQCRIDPAGCGITVNGNTDGSTQAGILQCQNDPASCDITVDNNTDGSTQAGILQCQNDPASCDITVDNNTDGSTQAGILQCQNNPASCDITVDGNTDGSTQAGILQCQNNPASCDIAVQVDNGCETNSLAVTFKGQRSQIEASCENNAIVVNLNTDGATEDGVMQCQADPAACGIIVNANTDGSTAEGMEICRRNPAACGITYQRFKQEQLPVYDTQNQQLNIPQFYIGSDLYSGQLVLIQEKPQMIFVLDWQEMN